MKKISLFLAVAILFCSTASAQLEKGKTITGGDFANLKLGLNKGNGYNIDIHAYHAWFLKNNFALGYKVNVGVSGSQYEGTNDVKAFDVFARYYFHKPGVDLLKHACFFAEGTSGAEENSYGNYYTVGFGFGFGPGVSYFITPNISLEALVKYNGLAGVGGKPRDWNDVSYQDPNQTMYQHSLSVNIGCALFLPRHGLRDVLRRKKKA